MFSDIWSWKGTFRLSEKNIGVPRIVIELRQLWGDARSWIEENTYPSDEIVIRFKHQLVNIHCYPNGIERHSRIMADILIESVFDKEVFSSHHSNMVKAGKIRSKYMAAIRKGDNGNIKPLIRICTKLKQRVNSNTVSRTTSLYP